MDKFFAVLQTEALKIRKSKITWITAAAFSIAPFMAGFFMFVLKHPDIAQNAGLLQAKTQMVGDVNWSSYINLHAQIIAVGGILVFGFITSWIFGREYADKTVKDLLALPYSRMVIVIAKFIVALITHFLLSILIVLLGIFIGIIIGLPGWSFELVGKDIYALLIVTLLTSLLCTPVAFFASLGAGYLASLGFVIMTLVLSQIIAALGLGDYFPWAIPGVYSGVTETEYTLGWNSVAIVFLTSVIGIISTLYYWVFVDQH